jgi:hypothetical protein
MMMKLMQRRLIIGLAAVAASVAPAWAEQAKGKATGKAKHGAQVEGAKLIHTIQPEWGFIDDPFAFDGASRLVYVNADAAGKADVVVWDVALGKPLRTVDISAFTATPSAVELAGSEQFFVSSRSAEGGPTTAAVIDGKGKVVRTFGPAAELVRTRYGGKDAIVSYAIEEKRPSKGPKMIHHTVEVLAVDTGKRLGKKTTLVTDLAGYSKQLDFTLEAWRDDYTVAVGIKGGSWDRKENQRSPDIEGWYEMPRRSFARKRPINDVMAHTKKMRILAAHPNTSDFLRIAQDAGSLQRVVDGEASAVELVLPLRHYDPRTLRQQRRPDGTVFFTLKIDPVNPDAVARKRADKEWLDLYRLAPGASKAVRKARLRIDKERELDWRATDDYWAIVPHHVGFTRGGKQVRVYDLD